MHPSDLCEMPYFELTQEELNHCINTIRLSFQKDISTADLIIDELTKPDALESLNKNLKLFRIPINDATEFLIFVEFLHRGEGWTYDKARAALSIQHIGVFISGEMSWQALLQLENPGSIRRRHQPLETVVAVLVHDTVWQALHQRRPPVTVYAVCVLIWWRASLGWWM